jgi:hypothetical protein
LTALPHLLPFAGAALRLRRRAAPSVLSRLARLGAALAAFASALPPTSASVGWLESGSYAASLATDWVNNVSRTSDAPTRRDAATCDLEAGAAFHRQLSPAWLLSLEATANFHAVPKFDATDQGEAGGHLGLQRKFGLGPFAPVLRLDAGLSRRAARYAGDRGWTSDAGLRLAKRLIPALKLGVDARWLEHWARHAAFDLRQTTVGIDAAWDISDRWSLSGSAARLDGRIVANAAWSVWEQAIGGDLGPDIFNYYNSIPWEISNLYGDRWVSYNVEARAALWTLAATCALTPRTGLELRISGASVVNHVDVRYPTDSWGLRMTHRF